MQASTGRKGISSLMATIIGLLIMLIAVLLAYGAVSTMLGGGEDAVDENLDPGNYLPGEDGDGDGTPSSGERVLVLGEGSVGEGSVCPRSSQDRELNPDDYCEGNMECITFNIGGFPQRRCCPSGEEYVGDGECKPEGASLDAGYICSTDDDCGESIGGGVSNLLLCTKTVDGAVGENRCCSSGGSDPEWNYTGAENGFGGCEDRTSVVISRSEGALCTDSGQCDSENGLSCVDSEVDGVGRCCPEGQKFVGGTTDDEGTGCVDSDSVDRGKGAACQEGVEQCASGYRCGPSVDDFAGTRCCEEGKMYVGGSTVCADMEEVME